MMKRYLALIISALTLVFVSNATAQDGVLRNTPPPIDGIWNIIPDTAQKLDGNDLRTAFSGVTHQGQYLFTRDETDTFAFTETTRNDGTLTHQQGQEILTGIWNINGDQICYTYDEIWTYPVCFNIYKSGTCYYHHIRSSNGLARNAVTARSTPSTQEPDCDALLS